MEATVEGILNINLHLTICRLIFEILSTVASTVNVPWTENARVNKMSLLTRGVEHFSAIRSQLDATDRQTERVNDIRLHALTMASSPMPLPMISSSGTTENWQTDRQTDRVNDITYYTLTMANSPMPLPMFSSSGTTANLPASPDTLIRNRIPYSLNRSRYNVPFLSYIDEYLTQAHHYTWPTDTLTQWPT